MEKYKKINRKYIGDYSCDVIQEGTLDLSLNIFMSGLKIQ